MPVVPSGTREPTTPAGAGIRRVRIAASVMKPMRMAVVAVVVTMSGVATCTSGSVGSAPGFVYRADAPSAKQMIPPTVSSPWLTTCVSSANSTSPSPTSSRPATLSGRLPKPMNASRSAIAPRIPVTKFGFWSSNRSPYRPIVNSTKATFGSLSRWSSDWNAFIPTSATAASVSSSVCGTPLTVTSWPSACASTSSRVAAMPSTAPAATAALAG